MITYIYEPNAKPHQEPSGDKKHIWKTVLTGEHGKWFFQCEVCGKIKKRLSCSARVAATCPGPKQEGDKNEQGN